MGAILQSVPRLWGWWRPRWRCATLAGELDTRRKIAVSAETRRRGLPAVDWEGKRAKLRAQAEDPPRGEKLARSGYAFEQLRAGAARFFADELAIPLLPKVGYQWLPTGTQVQVRTPGTTEKRSGGGGAGPHHGNSHPRWLGAQHYRALPGSARHARPPPPGAPLFAPHDRGR